MNGKKLFSFSLNIVPNLINNLLKENNINKKDLDFILLHQASNIINSNIANRIEIKKNKFLTNYSKYGNTVSSTLPLLMHDNINKLKRKKLVLCGFGVGLSAASCFYEFK